MRVLTLIILVGLFISCQDTITDTLPSDGWNPETIQFKYLQEKVKSDSCHAAWSPAYQFIGYDPAINDVILGIQRNEAKGHWAVQGWLSKSLDEGKIDYLGDARTKEFPWLDGLLEGASWINCSPCDYLTLIQVDSSYWTAYRAIGEYEEAIKH